MDDGGGNSLLAGMANELECVLSDQALKWHWDIIATCQAIVSQLQMNFHRSFIRETCGNKLRKCTMSPHTLELFKAVAAASAVAEKALVNVKDKYRIHRKGTDLPAK